MLLARKEVKKLTIILIISMVSAFFLAGCGEIGNSKNENVSKSAFLLNTYITVTLYSDNEVLAQQCIEECKKYERIFSRTDPDSELYALNACDSMDVSHELLTVLTESIKYSELTDGAFDITMGGVSDLYGFTAESPRVPTDKELKEALSHTGYEKITINGNTVTLEDPELIIDLGAVAKGYIADKLADLIVSSGEKSALIDLGGNIMCVGSKPDGSHYRIGLQYPFEDTAKPIGTVKVSDRSVVTSGIYERCFEEDGKLYHHILDPKTGLPYENDILAVSIISDSSMEADILSTSCFALGLDKGIELINSIEGTEVIYVTNDYGLHYTPGAYEYIDDNAI